MQSSSTRRKTAFVPWLAALIIGATAHAGWLIHELREPKPAATAPIQLSIDARPQLVERSAPPRARHTPAPARARSLAPSCRHASRVSTPPIDEHDLDMWIEQVDRYTYSIDRSVLERVALADYDGDLLARVGVVARALGLAEPIELRNIRAGTPLFVLGLRTGDRVRAIATRGGEVLEEVAVSIERRGRPIALVYRLI
ncbi:MAG TPA: hypothetical protein VM869_19885 [Enhygromyxa sp.]|nr:hypothetical protein [Enhygromyxa sp.]